MAVRENSLSDYSKSFASALRKAAESVSQRLWISGRNSNRQRSEQE